MRRNRDLEIFIPVYEHALTCLLNSAVSLLLEWWLYEEKDRVCFIKNMYKHHSARNRLDAPYIFVDKWKE